MLYPSFCDEHALWPAKAAEGGVGGNVGFTQVACHSNVGYLVWCITMEKGSIHHLQDWTQCNQSHCNLSHSLIICLICSTLGKYNTLISWIFWLTILWLYKSTVMELNYLLPLTVKITVVRKYNNTMPIWLLGRGGGVLTAPDKSKLWPALLYTSHSTAVIFPSFVNPTWSEKIIIHVTCRYIPLHFS